jgi:hypothetical protein
MGKPESNHSMASWNHGSKDCLVEIKIRRKTLIAFAVSLLIHGVVLIGFTPKDPIKAASVANPPPTSISVRLAGLEPKKPQPKNSPPKQKKVPPAPPVIVVEKEASAALPQPVVKPPPAAPQNNAPEDLTSYIRAQKQRAQEREDNAARENALASANARGPTAEELRDDNIRRNLQQPGASGIFKITYRMSEKAQFTFRGWKNDYSNSHLEIIDVEAGADGDIDRAIVRKMIEIIRREYKGDFNWESRRLDRVLVLSARIEDTSGLEEFLLREFSLHGNGDLAPPLF